MIINFKKKEITIYTFFNQWWIKIDAKLDIRIGFNRIENYLKFLPIPLYFTLPRALYNILHKKNSDAKNKSNQWSSSSSSSSSSLSSSLTRIIIMPSLGTDKYNFKWCNIVRFCLCIIIIIIMSDQPIPEAAFEIEDTDVCEERLNGRRQGKKNTIWPFFSCTCYDFKVLFFFTNLFKALLTSRSTYVSHVAAARKRNHQWCVSLTPNNTWVTYIA